MRTARRSMRRRSNAEGRAMSARTILAVTLVVLAVVGCATAPSKEETAAKASAMLKASFKANGQAGLDRLDQDETQRVCSAQDGKAPSKDVAEKIEKLNFALIKYPADGKLLGDWKNGEKIAQEGRGMQFSDDPAGPVGANCFSCHQLAPQGLSYGTIGPSLYQFAEVRCYRADNKPF